MKTIALLAALVAAIFAAAASAASTVTAERAFLKAQTCLKAHGARSVLSVGLTGGAVSFNAAKGSASWKYRVTKAYPLNQGTVLGVSLFTYSSRMPAGTRLLVRGCVLASTH